MNFTKVLVALFFLGFLTSKAQQNETHDGHSHGQIDEFYLPLEFDKDSLKCSNAFTCSPLSNNTHP